MKKLRKLLAVSVLTVGLAASSVVLADDKDPGPKVTFVPGMESSTIILDDDKDPGPKLTSLPPVMTQTDDDKDPGPKLD